MNTTMKETNINEDGGEVQIDLWRLVMLYLRRWKLILVCALLLAGLALGYTANFITPLYRTGVMIYVNSVKDNQQIDYVSASNLATSQQLVSTYVNIIRSDTVLEKVADTVGMGYSAASIRGMMTAAQVEETELFTVYISHPDPQMAATIANAIAEVAPHEISEFVEGSSTKIIDYAKVPTSRYTPSFRKNTMMGGVLGGFLAVLYITLTYLLDVRIKSEEDLAQLFDLPMLGQIPNFAQIANKGSGSGYGDHHHHHSSGDSSNSGKKE